MISQPANLASGYPRLTQDQFIVLRSLARGRWLQGNQIEWKFNRSWRFVNPSKTSLDSAYSLQLRGLVTKGKCCLKCRRDVHMLTEAGLKFVSQANSPVQSAQHGIASISNPSITSRLLYWLGR
ncbi:hypothetical protein ALQ79_200766 [Pseudomonas amygdali pv. lachrymans]|nr:hypothetical protein ALQ79_200766 [Pseudomonas amygdali pv. lachrymans]